MPMVLISADQPIRCVLLGKLVQADMASQSPLRRMLDRALKMQERNREVKMRERNRAVQMTMKRNRNREVKRIGLGQGATQKIHLNGLPHMKWGTH